MQFEKAYKGITNIFAAEMISVCTAILVAVTAVMTFFGVSNDAVLSAAGVLAIVMGVLAFVAFILQLVGTSQAGKDEPRFTKALACILLGILASLVGTILQSVKLGAYTPICNAVGELCKIFVTFFVITGIISLAETVGDDKVRDHGVRNLKLILGLYIAAFVLHLLGAVLGLVNNESAAQVLGLIGMVASIATSLVSIVAYLYYLDLLNKGRKMLK